MKCLTVCEPYASAIMYFGKCVENRSWYTGYRGPLAIHAGKSKAYLDSIEDLIELCLLPEHFKPVFGAVLGTVDLVDCIHADLPMFKTEKSLPPGIPIDQALWAEGPNCFMLKNKRPLAAPYPCPGAQGFWEFDMSFAVTNLRKEIDKDAQPLLFK